MKHLSACLLPILLLGACAAPSDERAAVRAADLEGAQTLRASAPADDDALPDWLDEQRARIEAARTAAAMRFQQAEAACWHRFAVNACVREARAERRAVFDRMRQQELAVNDVQRKRRTAGRLRQLEEKQQQRQDKARDAD